MARQRESHSSGRGVRIVAVLASCAVAAALALHCWWGTAPPPLLPPPRAVQLRTPRRAAVAAAATGPSGGQPGARDAAPSALPPLLAAAPEPPFEPNPKNLPCDALSKGLVRYAARNGTVMLVVVDFVSAAPLFRHWLGNARKAGIDYFLIAAADARTSLEMARLRLGDRCFMLEEEEEEEASSDGAGGGSGSGSGSGASDADADGWDTQQRLKRRYVWGDEAWLRATWRKVGAAEALLRACNVSVVVSDVDVAWLADPRPYFAGLLPPADLLVSLDIPASDTPAGDGGLEHRLRLGRNQNTGVLFARPTPGVVKFFGDWKRAKAASVRAGRSDQAAFNALLLGAAEAEAARRGVQGGVDATLAFGEGDANRTVSCVYNCTFALGHLPPARFLNAYTYSIARLHAAKRVDPISLHLTFLYGGQAAKVARLRDAGLAHDPPEQRPAGAAAAGERFFSFDLAPLPPPPSGFTIWADLASNGNDTRRAALGEQRMVEAHLRDMDTQLQQLWVAAGIAMALNRTLVLPQFRCGCVKNWHATDRCRLGGDGATALPFACTIDQFLDVERLATLAAARPDGGFAPLRVREAGFIRRQAADAGDGPPLPKELLDDGRALLVVEPEADSADAAGDSSSSSSSSGARTEAVQRHLSAADQRGSSGGARVGAGGPPRRPCARARLEELSPEQVAALAAAGVCAGQEEGIGPPRRRVALTRGALDDRELRAALAAARADAIAWLHAPAAAVAPGGGPTSAFRGFASPGAAAAHQRALDAAATHWCCRGGGSERGGLPDGHLLRARPIQAAGNGSNGSDGSEDDGTATSSSSSSSDGDGSLRPMCRTTRAGVDVSYHCSAGDPPVFEPLANM